MVVPMARFNVANPVIAVMDRLQDLDMVKFISPLVDLFSSSAADLLKTMFFKAAIWILALGIDVPVRLHSCSLRLLKRKGTKSSVEGQW